MDTAVTSAITTLVSTVIGGALAAWGAMKAVERSSRDLEVAEIRKERINCLVALSGFRFAMNDPKLPVEWQARLMFELNKIPTLWSGNERTLNSLQRYLSDASPDHFVSLLRLLSGETKLDLEKVRDEDLIRYARPKNWNQA
jgi:hypothetical protein